MSAARGEPGVHRRAILSAPGSRGDVNPIVAIGRELTRMGFECHVSVAEPYAEIVENAGLIANVVIDRETFDRVVSQTHFWRPWTGARRVLTEVAEKFFQPHLSLLDRLFVPGSTAVVAHPLDFAARVFRDVTPECRLSSVHLAPAMMRCPESPPRLLPDRGWTRAVLPEGWPRLNRLTYYLADIAFLDPALAPAINEERKRRAGLTPVRRLLNEWWHSPDQILALYPRWYAPEIFQQYAQPRGDAAALQSVGFPLDDGESHGDADGESDVSPPETNTSIPVQPIARRPPAFTEPIPRDKPLLVTTGSAHHGDESFVTRVAEIAAASGVSVVWCCPSNPGGVTHPNIRCVGYIPLGQWLPHCRGIIHHGGIGTTSRAIHAGTPQLIRPMAFDQFDNAARVERLGFGVYLRHDRYLAGAIDELLAMADGQTVSPPAEPDTRVAAEVAAERAAKLIAGLLAPSRDANRSASHR
ncbi:nucleotide disphospho-sugar-binding domain-containing protein [Rhodopirellula sallentina]|uniref:Rhamnosyltransferase I, subunit B n=1 Tax=Rhodopirellula sallentina SM41 TaxID=1263870 RepID=M5TUU5_9BACT|nr:nucleotide disphospho-sugar-binding domain-containing protein [Rhodopirellula sallentina]EMI52809.1 rhamnosyltransferase I, subunit B [Rhodopirellula sallentina SM41]